MSVPTSPSTPGPRWRMPLGAVVAVLVWSYAPSSAQAVCGSASTYSNAITGNASLVAYWRLGEASGTAACESKTSGTTNNGTYTGGFTLGVPGAIKGDPDTAAAFNGSTGFVGVTPSGTTLNVADTFTIEAWVKRGSTAAGCAPSASYQTIAAKQSGAWVFAFTCDPANPDRLVLRRSGDSDVATSAIPLTDTSAWHHVVATKNGPTARLYIDGIDVTGSDIDRVMTDNSLQLVIGQSSSNTTTVSPFKGSIDEVALYNAALTPTQIAGHYTTGAGMTPDPAIAAAGDIACNAATPVQPPGNPAQCHQLATSDILLNSGLSGLLPLGDDQYESGSLSEFQNSYDLTWARGGLNGIVHPVPGNHEYNSVPPPTGAASASGYFDYFDGVGSPTGVAGPRDQGYYSYNLGSWHLIALNSDCMTNGVGGCGTGSPQEQWLRTDLAAHQGQCLLAYWHHPLFSSRSAEGANATYMQPVFGDLYAAGADIVLNGHKHQYERFDPQDPSGNPDPAFGLREFVVGTGGRDLAQFDAPQPNSVVQDPNTFGVLRLVLHAASYEWHFEPQAGLNAATVPAIPTPDFGSASCHLGPRPSGGGGGASVTSAGPGSGSGPVAPGPGPGPRPTGGPLGPPHCHLSARRRQPGLTLGLLQASLRCDRRVRARPAGTLLVRRRRARTRRFPLRANGVLIPAYETNPLLLRLGPRNRPRVARLLRRGWHASARLTVSVTATDGARGAARIRLSPIDARRRAGGLPAGGPMFQGVAVRPLASTSAARAIDQQLTVAAQLGANTVRVEVPWRYLEPTAKGSRDDAFLGLIDHFFSAASARRLKVVMDLDGTPCWASSAPDDVRAGCTAGATDKATAAYPPASPQDYADVAAFLAGRYGSRMLALEVYNEPDNDRANLFAGPAKPEHYAAVLKAAYPAIKAASPNTQVLAGSLVQGNASFLQALFRQGIQGSYDGIAVHYDGLVLASLRATRAVQLAAHDESPLWLTEFGWATCNAGGAPPGCVSRRVQGRDVVDILGGLRKASYVHAAVIDRLQDDSGYSSGLTTSDLSPKPAFALVQKALSSGSARPRRIALRVLPAGNHLVVRGSGPAGDKLEVDVFKGGVQVHKAIVALDAANRFVTTLPSTVGMHGVRVRVYQYWSGASQTRRR